MARFIENYVVKDIHQTIDDAVGCGHPSSAGRSGKSGAYDLTPANAAIVPEKSLPFSFCSAKI